MRHEGVVNAASFSPDGRRIVTASDDHTARVWDAESGNPLGEPMRHEGQVEWASFSPDGRRIVTVSWRRIVTASRDKTAQVWDAAADLDLLLPAWVPELAEALGGRRFIEEGLLVPTTKSSANCARTTRAERRRFLVAFWPMVLYARTETHDQPGFKITVGEPSAGEPQRKRMQRKSRRSRSPIQRLIRRTRNNEPLGLRFVDIPFAPKPDLKKSYEPHCRSIRRMPA